MSSTELTSYDLMPYPNYAFPQTHPDRAAVIATLMGLNAAPVERCRVLELGCGAGSNLLPMAEELPDSTFVGIDLAQRQIAKGRKAVADLGLTNLELRHKSITDFDAGAQTFDYIICHGVYSWVPASVQDRILEVCRKCLQPNGVAYVSYNTLPGWHMRGMIRDMMLYHGRRFTAAGEQVAQARGLLDFLVSSVPMEGNPYGQYLRSELERLRLSPDAYLYHDHLEEHNSPVYFHQFVERAASHGLGYLADVDLHTMLTRNLPAQVGQTLERVSADFIQLEQYMDFLHNRSFRQSLLCHAQVTPPPSRLIPDVLSRCNVASELRPVSASPDLQANVREDFKGPNGASAYSIHSIVKAALVVLGAAWPGAVPFQELCGLARAKTSGGGTTDETTKRADEQQLRQSLLHYYTIGNTLVELRLRQPPITTQPGLKPKVRSVAQWQAASGWPITNLRHELIEVDELGRQVLRRLDGQHTVPDVARELAALVATGQLRLPQPVDKRTSAGPVEQVVVAYVKDAVDRFAAQGFLLS